MNRPDDSNNNPESQEAMSVDAENENIQPRPPRRDVDRPIHLETVSKWNLGTSRWTSRSDD